MFQLNPTGTNVREEIKLPSSYTESTRIREAVKKSLKEKQRNRLASEEEEEEENENEKDYSFPSLEEDYKKRRKMESPFSYHNLLPPETWRHIYLYGLGTFDKEKVYLRVSGCIKNILKVTFVGGKTIKEIEAGDKTRSKQAQLDAIVFYVANITLKKGTFGIKSAPYFDNISLTLESNCDNIAKRLAEIYTFENLKCLDIDAFFHFEEGFGAVDVEENITFDVGKDDSFRFKRTTSHAKRGDSLYYNVFAFFPRLIAEMSFYIKHPLEEEAQRLLHWKNYFQYLPQDTTYTVNIPWKQLETIQLGNCFFLSYKEDSDQHDTNLQYIANFFHSKNNERFFDLDEELFRRALVTFIKKGPIHKFGSESLYGKDRTAEDIAATSRISPFLIYHDTNDLTWLKFLDSILYLAICSYSRFPNSLSPYYDRKHPWQGKFHGDQSMYGEKNGTLLFYQDTLNSGEERVPMVINTMLLRIPERMENVEQLVLIGHDIGDFIFPVVHPARFEYPKLKVLVLVNTSERPTNFFIELLHLHQLERLYYYDNCDYRLTPEQVADPTYVKHVSLEFMDLMRRKCAITLIVPPEGTRSYQVKYLSMENQDPDIFDDFTVMERAHGIKSYEAMSNEEKGKVLVPDLHGSLEEQFGLQNKAYGIPHIDMFGYIPDPVNPFSIRRNQHEPLSVVNRRLNFTV